MRESRSYLYLIFLFNLLISPILQAQDYIVDSLKQDLARSKTTEQAVKMAMLARVMYEGDPESALKSANEALKLARKNQDKAHLTFCYATLGYIAMQRGGQVQAKKYIDTAVTYAGKTKDPATASYAWLRRGWFDLVVGNNEQAMVSLLKAAGLAEKQQNKQAFSYQSLINHYMSSIYAYGSDTAKQRRYAVKSLWAARRSGRPDDIQTGYMTVAHSFLSKFERDLSQRKWLDSSKAFYKQAMQYYLERKSRIYIQSNGAATALNLGNIYFKYHPRSFRDSAEFYITIALNIGRKTKSHEVIANCYGLLSEYALADKEYKRAETFLLNGLAELESLSPGADLTRSRLMLGLANVAERAGNSGSALAYYKRYIDYYKKVFDAEKLATVQRMEEEFHTARQQDEIRNLKERESFNRRSGWLYLCIGAVSILFLCFLLLSYHYKLKAARRQEQLAEQEMQKAALKLRLQESEAERLVLAKQESDLQITLKEQEQARLEAQQELLQDRTEWLEKELLAGVLKIEEKNAILDSLKARAPNNEDKITAKHISQIVNQHQKLDEQQYELSQMHPNFFNSLQEKCGNNLTRLDLKYCSYILMGLDTKEIAIRLGVEPKSIRMARYRLKQKFSLSKDDNLDQFVRSFGSR
ncbi:LuxR family transcriptional regulator [Pedobacter sp. SYP-B3415]|uniref:LuxR family transcriptional regulator n=1 Tax=Pedobacter sp. SYP-B3415 TaxID=2496641 RepID=UPI00101C468D|nr:LuxR family transcriptional regulator [Pedobacter sp. SYP-B3415]